MKHFVIATSVLLLASVAVGQDIKHAPTVEQCRADQRLWLSEFEDAGANVPEAYSTMNQWIDEMMKCVHVDSENGGRYVNTMSEAAADQKVRLQDFLLRHGLSQQFLDEDAAGKR